MNLFLTFDDGPSAWTAAVLDALADAGASGAFFVIGNRLAGSEALLERMLAEGHVVGNHSYSHPRLGERGDAQVRSELTRTNEELERLTGRVPTLFRAPYLDLGADPPRVLAIARTLGLEHAGCDVVGEDWLPDATAEAIAERVLAGAEPDAVVLLHDGFPRRRTTERDDCTPTVDALRLLLPELAARGYAFPPLS